MIEEDLYRVDYTFSSFLNDGSIGEEPSDYVSEISLNVYKIEDGKEEDQLIGKGCISLLHLNRALDQDFPLYDIFDATANILEMAQVIFNLDNEDDYWSKLDEYYNYDLLTSYDVCFIERIELLPEFRGKDIGKWVVKNILERFYGSCGLVVLHAFPLQHEDRDPSPSKWVEKMKLQDLERDLEQAQYKLFHYYQQMGFTNPFDPAYFFIRPEEFEYEQFIEDDLP